MVPPTRLAVTLLFQSSDKIREAKEAQRLAIEKDGQKVSDKLVYLKQYVGNACGTIACLHSMANNAEALGLSAESPVGKFLDTIKGKSPQDAGLALVDATDLHSASEASAQGGQTSAPQADADVDAHFICFVEKDGELFELDGNKAFPINHGPTGGDLLGAACKTIK
ncbi:uch1, partial [Symbiodinium necroappetens]